MKKVFAFGLAAALSLTALAGCGPKEPDNKNNTAPTIDGVEDSVTVTAGTQFDALAGVTATDKEDGDLTSEITVEANGLTFSGGKVTPDKTGNYEIIYSVKDSGDLEGNAYCTLVVTPAAAAAKTLVSYKDFDVADKTLTSGKDDEGTDYWKPEIREDVNATAKLSKGALVFNVTSLHAGNDDDDHLQLSRRMDNLTAGDYEFIVWAKSSVATKINMNALVEEEDTWDIKNLEGGKYNLEIGTEMTTIREHFTLTNEIIAGVDKHIQNDQNENVNGQNETSILFRICIDGNDSDRPSGAFDLSIYKIAIYQTTGQNKTTDLYTSDFTSDVSNVTMNNAGDGAAATVERDAAENAAKVVISQYNTTGGIWSLTPQIELKGATVTTGQKYGYEVVLKAQTAIPSVELLIENDGGKDNGETREFKGCNVGTTDTKIEGEFTAKFNAQKPMIFLNMGKKEGELGGVTSNTLWIKSVRFFKIEAAAGSEAEKTVNKVNSYFAQKKASADTNYPFDFFNGSDEGTRSNVPGLATVYTENKNLVYEVFQGGTEDWHSKLIVGYNGNPVALPGNSYYTVRIKIKASKAFTCPLVALHEIDTNWDLGMVKKLEKVNITTDWTTVELAVTEPFVGSKNCELLLQFGSAELAALGGVKIEIAEITVEQRELIG